MFLLLCKLQYPVENSFSQLCLQELLSGGIDPFSHDQEPAVHTEFHCPAFGAQITDALFSPLPFRHSAFSKRGTKLSDIIRSGAAAASKHGCACFHQLPHLLRKFLRLHAVTAVSVLIQKRKPCIGFRDDRNPPRTGSHIRHDLSHMGRPGGTVDTDSRCPQTLQHHGGSPCVRTVKRPPVSFKCHSHHNRQITGFLCGDQGSPAFRQAHHGLHHQQVGSRLRQCCDLFFIDIDQLFQLHFTHGFQQLTRHRQITGDIHGMIRPGRRLSGNGNKFSYHGPHPAFQGVLRKLHPIGSKSWGIQNIRSGRHILLLQLQHDLPVFQYPLFRTDS